MDWLQISFETTAPDPLEDCLLEAGAVAVTMVDAADQPLLEPLPGETPMWDRVVVTGLFHSDQDPQSVITALQTALQLPAPPNCEITLLEDRDWVRAWMARYEPLRFGEKLWICPHHHEVDAPGATVVRLDPGLAFGTGTHPTTALCLRWLDQAPLAGKTVIDYGCGSGILAIAAALLGANTVLAVDIDPQAITATQENALRNDVSAQIRCGKPEVLQPLNLTGRVDLVIANILAGPLTTLAPELIAFLKPGGELVLAGLLEAQMQEVQRAYPQIAWLRSASLDGWTRLHGKLPDK